MKTVRYQVEITNAGYSRWVKCDLIMDHIDPSFDFTSKKQARKYKKLREARKLGGMYRIVKVTKEIVK